MEVTVKIHILAATMAAFFQMGNGQYQEISSLPPHLRNLAHCPAPGYYGDANSCVRFYRCVDYGIPAHPMFLRHDFLCAAGTVFDPYLSVCNHPSRVHARLECHPTYGGGRVVPTIPPMQGLQGNSVDLETSGPVRIPGDGPSRTYGGYYYSEPEMLIQPRVNSIPSRKWPNKYIVASKGPVLHVQVQVPYTMTNK